MLTSDLRLINSPVIVVMNGEENEYKNGAAAEATIGPNNRLEVKSLSAREGKIVVRLAGWETNAPFNFIGEAVVE